MLNTFTNRIMTNITTNKFRSIISNLIETASNSTLNHQLAACIMKNHKKIKSSQCNAPGEGYGGSRHAELRAALSFFGKTIKLTNTGWKIPNELKRKNRNRSMLVIRIGTFQRGTVNLVNARPCHHCLEMMRSLGFREVHYSSDNGMIITEKIDHMISVHASHVTIKMDFIQKNKDNVYTEEELLQVIDKQSYYDNLIKKEVPDRVRYINFQHFIEYNLKNLSAKYRIVPKKHNVLILNSYDEIIKTISII
jgi:hypothetical protein